MSQAQPPIAVARFASTARRFCQLLDQPVTAPTLAEVLAELHMCALQLPDLGVDADSGDDAPHPRDLPPPSPPFDLYWLIYDPFESDEPVAGSLTDDIADIRADLMRGLSFYDQGRIVAACWEWRFHFGTHWGAHLVSAQRALFWHIHR